MAFSTRTLTHTFINADNTPGSGKVEFTLSKRISNDGSTVMPGSITISLAANGSISQVLTANNDTDTVPADSQWRVDLNIAGCDAYTAWITVPSGTGSVDLASLLPTE